MQVSEVGYFNGFHRKAIFFYGALFQFYIILGDIHIPDWFILQFFQIGLYQKNEIDKF